MQQEQALKDKDIQAQAQQLREQQAFQAAEAEKRDQKDILVAEIRAAGMGAAVDLNQNAQSDYMDSLRFIQDSENFQNTMALDQTKQQNQSQFHEDKMQLAREKMANEKNIADKQLQIAKENKNQYDLKAKQKAKAAKKKK